MSIAWQQRCTQALTSAVKMGGPEGIKAWLAMREEARRKGLRVTIADADLSSLGLENYDLSRCYIIRCDFKRTNFTGANFAQAIFRECNADYAIFDSATLQSADISGLRMTGVSHNKDTNFDISDAVKRAYLDRKIGARVEVAKKARNFEKNGSEYVLTRAMLWITDYGYSLTRLCATSLLCIIIFGLFFSVIGALPIVPALVFSTQNFVGNAGECSSVVCCAAQALESLIGVVFIALLTAIMFFVVTEQK